MLVLLSGCLNPMDANGNSIEQNAMEYCDSEPNISAVYACGEYVQVVSSAIGAGSTFYKSDGSLVQCPVVAPDSMSEECKQIRNYLNDRSSCTKVC